MPYTHFQYIALEAETDFEHDYSNEKLKDYISEISASGLNLKSLSKESKSQLNMLFEAIEVYRQRYTPDRDNILKIFLAPEFYFRPSKQTKKEEYCYSSEEAGHIQKAIQHYLCKEQFKNWLVVAGTVVYEREILDLGETGIANVMLILKGGVSERFSQKYEKNMVADGDGYSATRSTSEIALVRQKSDVSVWDHGKLESLSKRSLLNTASVLSKQNSTKISSMKSERKMRHEKMLALKRLHSNNSISKNDSVRTSNKNKKGKSLSKSKSSYNTLAAIRKSAVISSRLERTKMIVANISDSEYNCSNIIKFDNLTFGLEICLEHSYSILRTTVGEKYKTLGLDFHLLIACGMKIEKKHPNFATSKNGYLLRADGKELNEQPQSQLFLSTDPNWLAFFNDTKEPDLYRELSAPAPTRIVIAGEVGVAIHAVQKISLYEDPQSTAMVS